MIRLATEDDAEQIGQLWAEMVAYHARFDALTFRPAENGAALYARNFVDRLGDGQTRVLVAERDGQIVGYVSGMVADITTDLFQPLRCGLLADIFVSADYRRQGIGRHLVERLMLWFRAKDVERFEWHVSAMNSGARAFWEAFGAEITILRMRARVRGEGE